MQNSAANEVIPSSRPYTHADHAKACHAATETGEALQQWVQVRSAGSTHCARLLEAWTTSDGADFWKVHATHPLSFTGSFPVKAVRQCSGLDGLCICAGEAANIGDSK